MLQTCFVELGNRKIQSVLVEGGAALINSLIKADLWDEAWVVTTQHLLESGIKAPLLHGNLIQKFTLDTDEIQIVHNPNSNS